MPHRGSALVGVALAALLVAISGPALACGNAMVYAVLFAKYPLAKTAYQSDLAARSAVLYEVPAFPGRPGQSYHRWSFGRAKAVLGRVHKRLADYAANHNEDLHITLMLADEVYIAQLSTAANGPRFEQPLTGLRASPRVDIYTTVSALGALDNGSISWQQALAERLLVLRSGETGAMVSRAFAQLFIVPK